MRLTGPRDGPASRTHPDGRRTESPGPQVYGHRGAPGRLPENTLGSCALAASMGVEFIEFDLVCSKDGVLIVRHEPNLTHSTEVAQRPEFADRRRSIEVGGHREEGWFTFDFTLEELRSLRATEPLTSLRPHTMDGAMEWTIPTLDEILALRAQASADRGWELGIIPEIKHSSLFHALGHDPEAALMASLAGAGLQDAGALVRIESFEVGNLSRLRHDLGFEGVLVFLAEDSGRPLDFILSQDERTFADLLTPRFLEELAHVVDAIGPSKHLVIGRTAEDTLADPSALVADCHAVGLEVTPWTFRAENHFLPAEHRSSADPAELGDYAGELHAFFEAGVDAVFCDQPDLALLARDAYLVGR